MPFHATSTSSHSAPVQFFLYEEDDGAGSGSGGEPQAEEKPEAKSQGNEVDESKLGDAGRRALEREREARREAEKKLKAREEEIEREKLSAQERLERERDDARAEAEKAKVEALRARVAAKVGLPADLVDRLKGSTEKEVTEDAETLVRAYGQVGGGLDGGPRGTGQSDPNDMNQQIRRLAGRA
jgi:hypothetical protein